MLGVGKAHVLDRAHFPPEQQAQYDVFTAKCTRCHSMERPIAALVTGNTPLSNDPVNKRTLKVYVARMMRKAKSGIDKPGAKIIVNFMVYARALAIEP